MLEPELRTSDDGDALERRALARTGDGVGERDTRPERLHDLVPTDPNLQVESAIESVKLVFHESSDFFGRVTVYDLQVYGTVPE